MAVPPARPGYAVVFLDAIVVKVRGAQVVQKTRIVYCTDGKRRRADCADTSFTFLGYAFRARNAPTRDVVSSPALTARQFA